MDRGRSSSHQRRGHDWFAPRKADLASMTYHFAAPGATTRSLSIMLIAFGFAGAAGPAQAQNPLDITTPVSGQTTDGKLSFSGTASVNSITRRGTIRGQTNTGIECRGTTTINLTLSHGAGTIACGQFTARFAFLLTKIRPPTGSGTGTLSDGRKVVVRIGQ